jgi:pyridoxine 4-dehydrogenase
MVMQQRTIRGGHKEFKVGEIGFGLMGTSIQNPPSNSRGFTYPGFAPRTTPLNEEEAFEALKAAVEAGSTYWNSAAYYGFGPNGELLNLELLAKFFTRYPHYADKVFLSVKGGFNVQKMGPDGSPEFLRQDVEKTLKALDGKKRLDLYEMGRVDKSMYASKIR